MWGPVVLLIGLALLGFGTREALIQRRLQREGIRVGGLVVRHHRSSGNYGPAYFAVVDFVDARGGRHTFRAKSSGVRGLPVGGPVPVRYLPDAPEVARIDLTRKRIADVGFVLAIATVVTAVGIWVLATGR